MDFGFLGTNSLLGQFAGAQSAGANGAGGLLEGLFAQLFGDLGQGEGAGDFSQIFGSGEALSGDVQAALDDYISALSSDVEGGEKTVLSGMMEELTLAARALVEVRKAMENLSQADVLPADLNEAETELTKAFMKTGMSLPEALEKARGIEKAMEVMNKVLGLPVIDKDVPLEEQSEQLAQVEQSLKVVVQEVSLYVVQLQVREQAFSAAQLSASEDVLSLVLNDKPLVPVTDALGAGKIAQERLANFQTAMQALFGGDQAASADGEFLHQEPEVVAPTVKEAVARPNEPILAATASAPKATPIPVETVVASADVAATSSRRADIQNNRRYERVEAKDTLKAPEGVEVYKWQTSKAGIDVLSQTADPEKLDIELSADGETPEEVLSQMSKDASQGKVSETARSDARVPFSERLMQAARAQVTQQVSVQMKSTAENGGGSVRIQLNPEELGTVDIEMEISNGRVHGVISAERPEVIEQMARELQFLKQSLESAGFSLGDQGMSFQLKQDGDAENDTQYASKNGQAGASENAENASGTGHASQRWIAPDRVLDVSV